MSRDAHFWVFVLILAVFLLGMIAVVALADNQPRQDDEKPEDAEQEPAEMRLAA